ncbi:MAG: heavy metal sensor histidine kinase [Burkholderiaceae bacterium]
MTAPAAAAGARRSLAARLVLLFAAATAVLLAALGVGLASLLRVQLEARDREEIDGKTELVQHLLRELATAERIDAERARFADLRIGHSHLQLGLRSGARWLVEPEPGIAALIDSVGGEGIPYAPRFGRYTIGHDVWWLRRLDHVDPDGRTYVAYIAQHVSPAQQMLGVLGGAMAAAGVLGVMASAALGWWAARRGLAPIAVIARAAERVTADRLGQPLRADDAPAEVRGLIVSINRMLERLRESFRSLDDFSADLAHELRTPLNNLMLMTQVTLSRPRSADEYREALHSNLVELERLQRMVSDMLFLARADKGMIETKFEPVDLAQEAASVAEFFEAAADEKGQRIEVDGRAYATCDRSMARRAITNLLSNAVRYAPAAALIRVDARSDAQRAQITVENPASLSQDELQRLFRRFARGGRGSAVADGAGLGLSIVESIMRLHGGSVTAEADGTRVRVTLAFAAAGAAKPARLAPAQS